MPYKYAYGNNKQFAALAFENRKFYDTKVLPLEKEDISKNAYSSFIDMYIDKPFYGRIDIDSNSVFTAGKVQLNSNSGYNAVPLNDREYLKKFRDNASVQAMNFVVDAFEDMMGFYNRSCKTRSDLSKDGPYGSLAPKVGWISPFYQFGVFVENLYYFYRDNFFLADDKYKNSIKSFKDFLHGFFHASMLFKDDFSPLFSIFTMSRFCSPNSSGLIVEIAIDDHSDDFIKTDTYLNDNNFEFFKSCCSRYGFYIDRNAPWRVIANVSSGNMLPYMQKYNLNNPREVFDKQFLMGYNYDLMFLKQALITIYKKLVSDYPNYIVQTEDECGLTLKELKREDLSEQEYYSMLKDKDLLIPYVELRIANMRVTLSEQEKNKIMLNVKQILVSRGLKEAMKYVNGTFRGFKKVLMNPEYFKPKTVVIIQE